MVQPINSQQLVPPADSKRRPWLFWLILCSIAVLGLLSSQYLFERVPLPILADRKVRYLLLLAIILLITRLGYYSWRRFGHGWQHKVWLGFYLISLFFLGVMAVIDQFFSAFTYATLVQLHHYRVFLLSSLPYIVLYLLTRILTGKKLTTRSPGQGTSRH